MLAIEKLLDSFLIITFVFNLAMGFFLKLRSNFIVRNAFVAVLILFIFSGHNIFLALSFSLLLISDWQLLFSINISYKKRKKKLLHLVMLESFLIIIWLFNRFVLGFYANIFLLFFSLINFLHFELYIRNWIKDEYPILEKWLFSQLLLLPVYFITVYFKYDIFYVLALVIFIIHFVISVWTVRRQFIFLEEKIKKYRSKLFRSEKDYLKIFEHSPAMYLVLNHEFEIIDCNKRFLNSIGIPYEDILESNLLEFIPADFQNKIHLLKDHLDFHKGASGEFAIYNPEKNDSMDVFLSAISEAERIFVIMQDITAVKWMQNSLSNYAEQLKKEMEKAKAADKMKSIFLANMSHEIRTPLTSIIGFATLLQETELSDTQLDYLEKIINSSDHLLKIINDIIDLSKIESGKMDIEVENLNLNYLFRDVHDIIYPLVARNEVDFEISLGERLKRNSLLLDGFRLKQVLINLLSNSAKFTNRGFISLKAFIKDDTILFEVKDSGIGIAKEKQKVIFDPFVQAEDTLHRTYGGTGLGLAISKRLISLMGGEIYLDSALNEGTSVTISFPVKDIIGDSIDEKDQEIILHEEENDVLKQSVNFTDSSSSHVEQFQQQFSPENNPVLLVGEDNDSVYMLLDFVLKKQNIETVRGEDGEVTFELYKKYKDSLKVILLDINLPKVDGIEIARRIKEDNKDAQIIGFSACYYDEIKNQVEGLLSGYIKKPFKVDEIYQILKQYL